MTAGGRFLLCSAVGALDGAVALLNASRDHWGLAITCGVVGFFCAMAAGLALAEADPQ